MNIVIFGAPGAGKGTQAQLVAPLLYMVHINAGEVLRQEVASNTEIGQIVEPLMKAGNLVPDSIVIDAIRSELDNNKGNNIIFDGYPRSISQADYLESKIKEYNQTIDKAVFLNVPDDVLLERLSTRKRADDTEEIIKHRLEVYKSNTAPLIEYYINKGIYVEVDGTGSVDEVTSRIIRGVL